MDEFITKFLTTVLSEAGLVAVMLLAAVYYQTKQISIYRNKNENLHKQVYDLATSQISAMNNLQSVLEKAVDMVTFRDSTK